MIKRICPDEITLSEYYCGKMSGGERLDLERHLAACKKCRVLISETGEVLKRHKRGQAMIRFFTRLKKDMWLFGAVAALAASFLAPKHFLQFLAIGFLMGMKWIIGSKTAKMLITVYEALHRPDGGEQKSDGCLVRSKELRR